MAGGYEHRMFRVERWKKENKRAFEGGIWIAGEPSLDCVVLHLFGAVKLGRAKKIKKVPVRLFERWLKAKVAKEIVGKS
jgi:hypothetical protein